MIETAGNNGEGTVHILCFYLEESPFSRGTYKTHRIFNSKENNDNHINVLEGKVEYAVGINLKIFFEIFQCRENKR